MKYKLSLIYYFKAFGTINCELLFAKLMFYVNIADFMKLYLQHWKLHC